MGKENLNEETSVNISVAAIYAAASSIAGSYCNQEQISELNERAKEINVLENEIMEYNGEVVSKYLGVCPRCNTEYLYAEKYAVIERDDTVIEDNIKKIGDIEKEIETAQKIVDSMKDNADLMQQVGDGMTEEYAKIAAGEENNLTKLFDTVFRSNIYYTRDDAINGSNPALIPDDYVQYWTDKPPLTFTWKDGAFLIEQGGVAMGWYPPNMPNIIGDPDKSEGLFDTPKNDNKGNKISPEAEEGENEPVIEETNYRKYINVKNGGNMKIYNMYINGRKIEVYKDHNGNYVAQDGTVYDDHGNILRVLKPENNPTWQPAYKFERYKEVNYNVDSKHQYKAFLSDDGKFYVVCPVDEKGNVGTPTFIESITDKKPLFIKNPNGMDHTSFQELSLDEVTNTYGMKNTYFPPKYKVPDYEMEMKKSGYVEE